VNCQIVSRYNVVYEGPADLVLLPSVNGQLGILRNHVRMYTKLQPGIITVRLAGEDTFYTATGGIAEVKPDVVRILVDSSENVDEIDVERALEAKKRAEEAMKNAPSRNSTEFMRAMMEMKKSNLRISASQRRQMHRGTRNMQP